MKKTLLFVFALVFTTGSIMAQVDKEYVGYWVLSSSAGKDKCANDQTIELNADGTATYSYGERTQGCKGQTEEFSKWKIVTKEEKIKKPTMKDIVLDRSTRTVTGLQIGGRTGIQFIVKKKKGGKMIVQGYVTKGDTTVLQEMTFVKKKKPKQK